MLQASFMHLLKNVLLKLLVFTFVKVYEISVVTALLEYIDHL